MLGAFDTPGSTEQIPEHLDERHKKTAGTTPTRPINHHRETTRRGLAIKHHLWSSPENQRHLGGQQISWDLNALTGYLPCRRL